MICPSSDHSTQFNRINRSSIFFGLSIYGLSELGSAQTVPVQQKSINPPSAPTTPTTSAPISATSATCSSAPSPARGVTVGLNCPTH